MSVKNLLVIILLLFFSKFSLAQKVTIDAKGESFIDILDEITTQTGMQFIYSGNLFDTLPEVTIQAKQQNIQDVLTRCLQNTGLVFEIKNKTIILSKSLLDAKIHISDGVKAFNEIRLGFAHGVVVDDISGAPIQGAYIISKQTKKGVVTDEQGHFFIKAAPNDLLICSYVGYSDQNMVYHANQPLKISLKSNAEIRDSVVLIGYGIQKRRDLTGSLAEVNVKQLQKAPVRSFEQALAGRMAGVVVTSMDGQPGSTSHIVIRGNNSITQSNSPLFVVDGFPLENPDNNAIDPLDVISITVLKDASATAIYGSRGANGVLLITTKRGHVGPPIISFNYAAGIQKSLKTMDMMDPYNYVKLQSEIDLRDSTVIGSIANIYLTNHHTLDSYKDSANIDWQSYIFRSAPYQNAHMAISGGSNATKYLISGSALDQNGIIINSGFKRYQTRLVVDQKINDHIKAGINFNYSYLEKYGISPSASYTGSVSSVMMYSVWGYRPFGENLLNLKLDPNVSSLSDYRFNPILNQTHIVDKLKSNYIRLDAFAQFRINNHLNVKITGGLIKNADRHVNFRDSLTASGSSVLINNGINGSIANSRMNSWVNENTINYENNFGADHHINILTGMTEQIVKFTTDGFASSQLPIQANDVSWLTKGLLNNQFSTNTSNALVSFLSRVNYTYKSKYLFTSTLRADGTSKFAPENHWGYFPSGALAWKFGEEKFIKNISFITSGKLRVSYGITSNNRVEDYAYLSKYDGSTKLNGYTFNDTFVSAIIPTVAGNRNLKWETTKQWDIGIDLALFQNLVTLTADIYTKNTSDLLLNAQIPPSFGYQNIYENTGIIQNQGLEISLVTTNFNKADFKWTSNFNISFNSNKILALAENQNSINALYVPYDNLVRFTPAFIAKTGKPIGLMYGPIWEGVYQFSDFDYVNGNYILKENMPTNGNARSAMQPGDIKYKDLNHDGTVNNKDYTVIGRGLAKYVGGFNNDVAYKNFRLNLFFQFSVGRDMLNVNKLVFEGNPLNFGLNQFASYEQRWTPENQSNTYFRAGGAGPPGNYFSSRIIEDGSYLRLKTVSLDYLFPVSLIKRFKIQSLRIYVAAQNLMTWTAYSGSDPEVSIYDNILTPNVDFSSYPRARTIVMGLNIDF